jgi:hypothetical protein
VAPSPSDERIVLTVTLHVELETAASLDLVTRLIGAAARAQGLAVERP